MTETVFRTETDGRDIGVESCKDGIELSVEDADGMAYTTLNDAEALRLAHVLIGMVMERQAAAAG